MPPAMLASPGLPASLPRAAFAAGAVAPRAARSAVHPRVPHVMCVNASQEGRSARRTVVVAGTTGIIAAGAAALAAATAFAAEGGMFTNPADNPRNLTTTGMQKFKQGNVEGSVTDFDRIIEVSPKSKPYLWQRGLSLYYVDRFEDGAEQFRTDVAVNPNDTEESIWAFICEARISGFQSARDNMLKVGRDPRPVMRAAYELFLSGDSVESLLAVADADGGKGGSNAFYANLYAGLYYEAKGDERGAQRYVVASAQTDYGRKSGDYMAKLAKVHCDRRGWRV